MVISRMQAADYRERLTEGVQAAAEAIEQASSSSNGARASEDGTAATVPSENGAGRPATKRITSAA
jgi:hypothetical protein